MLAGQTSHSNFVLIQLFSIYVGDFTTDLITVTRAHVDDNTLSNRYIIGSFPKSQHRPVLLHNGIHVLFTESIEKPRWNFSSVD
jgi:hypothetical protein